MGDILLQMGILTWDVKQGESYGYAMGISCFQCSSVGGPQQSKRLDILTIETNGDSRGTLGYPNVQTHNSRLEESSEFSTHIPSVVYIIYIYVCMYVCIYIYTYSYTYIRNDVHFVRYSKCWYMFSTRMMKHMTWAVPQQIYSLMHWGSDLDLQLEQDVEDHPI